MKLKDIFLSVKKRIKERIYYFINDRHGECTLPTNVIRNIAKALLPNIRSFFETEEGKKEFAEWKKQKEQEPANEKETEKATEKTQKSEV